MSAAPAEVAMLHRVVPGGDARIGAYATTTVDPALLERFLQRREAWRRLGLDELLEPGGGGPGYLLTFDDGDRSFRDSALELLERHEARAVLFVTTGFADGSAAPYELELADLLDGRGELKLPEGGVEALPDRAARERVYARIRLELRPLSPGRRARALDRLFAANGGAPSPRRRTDFLTPDELRELDRHPLVTIGAHTRRHPLLTSLGPLAALLEIRRSRSALERWLGRRVTAFAYPYGAHSALLRRLVRLAGFRWAFTTEPARVDPAAAPDPFALPRLDLARLGAES